MTDATENDKKLEKEKTGLPVVLYVEDEEELRNMMDLLLMQNGFKGITAVNGKHGLQKLENGARIDMIISDWKMPVMNGIEFLKEVRQKPAFANTPFIMLTAFGEKASVLTALKAGANDYIVKPWNTEVLLNKLREHLKGK